MQKKIGKLAPASEKCMCVCEVRICAIVNIIEDFNEEWIEFYVLKVLSEFYEFVY